ncbi:MAG TPA: hypothetical protein PK198_20850, partial [Saprospiraceae bacterium]|nr:hypothetical protein [Saprospiraceae bacterium]
LGLLPEVLANSGAMQKVYLKTDKGAILSRSEPRYEYPTVCIHRADLHRILLQNVPAQLYTHHALSDISHLENGQVALRFENGETRNFDAVIGADGIHSVVRQHIINDGKPIFRGYNVWRGVVATRFDIGYGSETHGNGKRVGIVPVKDGVYGWWATCNEDFMQSDEPEGSKNKLLRLFGDWHDPIPELMANTEHIIKTPWPTGSLCAAGRRGRLRCWAMRRTPPRPIWGKAAAWRWRAPILWPKPLSATASARRHFSDTRICIFPALRELCWKAGGWGLSGNSLNLC